MNQPPRGIQDYIHALEEGGGKILVRRGLLALLAIFVAVVYHLTEFRNFTTQEAMDSAQLARNLSNGEGFRTGFIRPLSLHLLKVKAQEEHRDEHAIYQAPHPDLANPPLYP